jgi:hypothetical protein
MKRIMTSALIGLLLVAPLALAIAPTAPKGKYRTKIGAHAAIRALRGTWVLNFTRGHFIATRNGTREGTDKFSVTGDTIRFQPTTTGCSGTGRYKFTIASKHLTFVGIADKCVGRRALLSHTLTKIS